MVQVEGLVAGKLASIAAQAVKQDDFGKHVQMTELKLDEMKRQLGGNSLLCLIIAQSMKSCTGRR